MAPAGVRVGITSGHKRSTLPRNVRTYMYKHLLRMITRCFAHKMRLLLSTIGDKEHVFSDFQKRQQS